MNALQITARTAKGNEYAVVVYEDPYPGRKGTEVLMDTCGKCNGNGVVSYGNITLTTQHASGRVCFQCNGRGITTRLVSSARQTAKRQAAAQTRHNAEAADFLAEAPAREAAEREADHEEALRIEAARNAKAKGFLGTEGDRLRNLNARVEMIRYYDSQNYVTGAPEQKCIVKFDVLGKVAIWFTDWSKGLEEGQFVTLTGTVKSLGNRDGEDQTVLTRCITK